MYFFAGAGTGAGSGAGAGGALLTGITIVTSSQRFA